MRVTPSLPQRGRLPKGSIPLTPSYVKFLINLLAQRGSGEAPERPPKGGNAHKIQKILFVNHGFELNLKKIVQNVRIYSAI